MVGGGDTNPSWKHIMYHRIVWLVLAVGMVELRELNEGRLNTAKQNHNPWSCQTAGEMINSDVVQLFVRSVVGINIDICMCFRLSV